MSRRGVTYSRRVRSVPAHASREARRTKWARHARARSADAVAHAPACVCRTHGVLERTVERLLRGLVEYGGVNGVFHEVMLDASEGAIVQRRRLPTVGWGEQEDAASRRDLLEQASAAMYRGVVEDHYRAPAGKGDHLRKL